MAIPTQTDFDEVDDIIDRWPSLASELAGLSEVAPTVDNFELVAERIFDLSQNCLNELLTTRAYKWLIANPNWVLSCEAFFEYQGSSTSLKEHFISSFSRCLSDDLRLLEDERSLSVSSSSNKSKWGLLHIYGKAINPLDLRLVVLAELGRYFYQPEVQYLYGLKDFERDFRLGELEHLQELKGQYLQAQKACSNLMTFLEDSFESDTTLYSELISLSAELAEDIATAELNIEVASERANPVIQRTDATAKVRALSFRLRRELSKHTNEPLAGVIFNLLGVEGITPQPDIRTVERWLKGWEQSDSYSPNF